ncbi:DUF2628 domain-containing protein [Plastoroseomonas arctica]|uniref:DUF2628 domain-containing protein n=1 Tax=Plastoroseomonas arctica TaxID=1509237 RepID=A0AAF1JW55_9PROT|nr:DUF2628 domain-containing protein [Plastoroseomonas arctica]MBR0654156.1 DUF2628 domain-containing protein [Plastoroseomonas arctica]
MSLHAYTLHTGTDRTPPLLLREGFSWGAFAFAPLWALRHGLWIAALGYVVVAAAVIAFAPGIPALLTLTGLHILAGFEGRDLQRMRLARQGRGESAVVLAPDEDTALWRALGNSDAARSAALRDVQGGAA